MFRFILLLATAAIVLVLTGWPGGLIDGTDSDGRLVSSTGTTATAPLNRPAVRVLSAPTELHLGGPGTVQGKNSPFDHPFYLAMNQAMGTTGNEYDTALVPDRVTTQIDYVRIWK